MDFMALTKAQSRSNSGGMELALTNGSSSVESIHFVAFDVFGRRLATCSADRFVRIWDLQDSGEWKLVAEWQPHESAVTMLSWVHPDFATVLATCGSNDNAAKIWEETSKSSIHYGSNASIGNKIGKRGWNIKAQLSGANGTVQCLEFAPKHWGLKLATGSADGCVRIYEAQDIVDLSQWSRTAILNCFVDEESRSAGVTSLSWSSGRFEPPTIVVGGLHLSIFRYNEASRTWQCILKLPNKGGNGSFILDVAWAPNVGRRYHYIASAQDQELVIYKLSNPKRATSSMQNEFNLQLESSQILETKASRCRWNVSGTVLASSDHGGLVHMWKADRDGYFKYVAQSQ